VGPAVSRAPVRHVVDVHACAFACGVRATEHDGLRGAFCGLALVVPGLTAVIGVVRML
jgi:hypothetical protein